MLTDEVQVEDIPQDLAYDAGRVDGDFRRDENRVEDWGRRQEDRVSSGFAVPYVKYDGDLTTTRSRIFHRTLRTTPAESRATLTDSVVTKTMPLTLDETMGTTTLVDGSEADNYRDHKTRRRQHSVIRQRGIKSKFQN